MEWSSVEKPSENNLLVMYFVVRESLNMSALKIGAQCAHACQLIINEHRNLLYKNSMKINDLNKLMRFNYWNNLDINKGFTKIVLKATDDEWNQLKEKYDPIIVTDAGQTEVAPGSETVMVIWPMYKNERCDLLKNLRSR